MTTVRGIRDQQLDELLMNLRFRDQLAKGGAKTINYLKDADNRAQVKEGFQDGAAIFGDIKDKNW